MNAEGKKVILNTRVNANRTLNLQIDTRWSLQMPTQTKARKSA